ncbi:cysteine rich repeat-containing protein [Consotaella salsifontis]|uniref:Cysteine rich repeat-containing protein n=1 Tax=Consotaella salsifontis TaxID=1365950 RepID=A0A1T4TAV8_9HYPH|nr:cysteine rich repeat-containing protein [Consotaella salsifontis]SKA37318.1 Cysteine rich repeat-containing protein [Consotaella salsifontis]
MQERHFRHFLCALTLATATFASVSAFSQTPPPQSRPMPNITRAEARAVKQACEADFRRYCPNVQPGGGRILECLQANAARLTPACHSALTTIVGQ